MSFSSLPIMALIFASYYTSLCLARVLDFFMFAKSTWSRFDLFW